MTWATFAFGGSDILLPIAIGLLGATKLIDRSWSAMLKIRFTLLILLLNQNENCEKKKQERQMLKSSAAVSL